LPAPKGAIPTNLGGGGAGIMELDDLPAPKAAAPGGGASSFFDDDNLPAPKAPAAPGGANSFFDDNLPAPKAPAAPGGGASSFFDDDNLPAPKAPTAPGGGASSFFDDDNLPAPKAPAPAPARSTMAGLGGDLPAPKTGTGTVAGLGGDLPAPKGFFDNPATGAGDLPAPKGFFDNPATAAPAPAPAPDVDLPAPKGFFDDVPAPAAAQPDAAADLPAPKGLFDDVPAPSRPSASAAPPSAAGPAGPAGDGVLDLDDLDLEPSRMAPLPTAGGQPAPGGGFFDEGAGTQAPPQTSANSPFALDDLDLEAPATQAPPAPAVPLELGGDGGSSEFDGVDLPGSLDDDSLGLEVPSASGGTTGGVVSFTTPSPGAATKGPAPNPVGLGGPPIEADDALDLNTDDAMGGNQAVAHIPPATMAAGPDEEAEGKSKKKKKKKGKKGKTSRLALIAGAAVAVLAAGGVAGFVYWQGQQEAAAMVAQRLRGARNQMAADAAGHWTRAGDEARKALAAEPENADALGLAAQAHYAAIIDLGSDSTRRQKEGDQLLNQATAKTLEGPELDKARGLRALVEKTPAAALKLLKPIAARDKRDPNAALYLTWALVANNDHKAAVAQADAALKLTPNRAPLWYAKGKSHVSLNERDKAREAFLKAIERDQNHVGALVGAAQVAETTRFNEREERYLEILQRKDIDKADPRAVGLAWALAGDEALRAGRVDEARSRYAKSLERWPSNGPATIGEGKVLLAQERYEQAAQRLKAALGSNPDNLEGTIAFAEAAAGANQFAEAKQAIDRAITMGPDDPNAHYVQGSILERDPQAAPGAAEAAYRKAVELAPEGEIAATVALSRLLVRENRGSEAVAALEPVEAAAEEDHALAVTLGVAYLGSNDAVRAETWFRKALERRPDDVEALLQLGLALSAQGKNDAALDALKQAFAADQTREDIGSRLALVYEDDDRDQQAAEVYRKLLQNPQASINVRARAGRFYARVGRMEEAAALGEQILAEDPKEAAGHFLRGEGYYQAGQYPEALAAFRDAVRRNEQAQYLEGVGRAAEAENQLEEALRAYGRSSALRPEYVRPRVGRGRIRVKRREYTMALEELEIAAKLAPNNAEIWFLMGESHAERAEERDAVDAYARSLRIDDEQPYVHYRLGRVFYDLDKARSAASAFAAATRRALGGEKWLLDAYFFQGYALDKAGSKCAAADAFGSFIERAPAGSARLRDAKRERLRLQAQCR